MVHAGISKAFVAAAASATLFGAAALAGPTGSAVAGTAADAAAHAARAGSGGCHLGHGVKHVVSILFDNVHFFRDNPDVPSDLQQMPHLLHFLQHNGTVFSNTHTPMIAHTADDSLSIYTGLYGDRHGQPLTNSYKTYNPDGSTDPASSFAYWTDPVYDTAGTPTPGHDTAPTMVYSPRTPARSGATSRQTPAPWVPFTRAGCNVGDFSTANMVLENTRADLPNVFGPNSPEVAQYNADPDSFKDQETTDYVGVAVHCARHAAVCATATGHRGNQTTLSHTAVPDRLPTEPGGYRGFKALYGAKYTAPQLGAGTANLSHHGYPVTDAQGNLVDLSGNEIDNEYSGTPGFPGFDPTATQSLAYVADMQEAGIPVTYAYIADLHEVLPGDTNCTSNSNTKNYTALGPGDRCYTQNLKAYDKAFATFFKRLRADGITKRNTVFEIGAEENDQFAGANVGRALQPSPAGCDGVTTPCTYTDQQIGELQVNLTQELAGTPSAATPYDLEPQGASIYVHGRPGAANPAVRQLERDTAAMRGDNYYSGRHHQHIVKYQAGAAEQRILHMRTADPLREPTYTMFPVPDYYFETSATDPAEKITNAYAWNHGYYSPNIDIIWSSFVGPHVARRGIDGPGPARGNEAQDPNSTHTVPQASRVGTWVEETDIRPTLLHLVGLRDDYRSDGEVISQALARPGRSIRSVDGLARVYQQLNSSVGAFATHTLVADSKALASGSASDDHVFTATHHRLLALAGHRDRLASTMKAVLARADAGLRPRAHRVHHLVRQAHRLIARSARLARGVGG
jgi:hypothetical protein